VRTSDLATVRVITDECIKYVAPVSQTNQLDTCHMAIADRTFFFLFTIYETYFI